MVTKIRQHCVNNFILRKIIIVKNFNGPEFLEPVVVIYFEQLVFLLSSSIFTVLFARHTTCFEYEFFILIIYTSKPGRPRVFSRNFSSGHFEEIKMGCVYHKLHCSFKITSFSKRFSRSI